MRKIRIVMSVDVDDIDWGKSTCIPLGHGLCDFELDECKYDGKPIAFKNEDDACDYLEFLYHEADPQYGELS